MEKGKMSRQQLMKLINQADLVPPGKTATKATKAAGIGFTKYPKKSPESDYAQVPMRHWTKPTSSYPSLETTRKLHTGDTHNSVTSVVTLTHHTCPTPTWKRILGVVNAMKTVTRQKTTMLLPTYKLNTTESHLSKWSGIGDSGNDTGP